MSLELLKMLPPKGINFNAIRGGIPEITSSDIAAALGAGNLSCEASLYLRIRFDQVNDDEMDKYCSKLWARQLMNVILPVAMKENWPSTGVYSQIPKVALDEMMADGICRSCRGTGTQLIENRKHDCRNCGGSGRKRFSKREVARRLGINHKTYSRGHWESRYNNYGIKVFLEYEDEIRQCLRKLG